MIRHFCDSCGAEVKRFARIEVHPKWQNDSFGGCKYELCDDCYDKIRAVIPAMPDNHVKAEERY